MTVAMYFRIGLNDVIRIVFGRFWSFFAVYFRSVWNVGIVGNVGVVGIVGTVRDLFWILSLFWI